ncbi:MAG: hypothetical protein ACLGIO_13585 [Acidimicrobiia bacterium]
MAGLIDHQRLADDIDAEVRRRRAADPAVAALEEELESSFAPFAPAPAGAGHGFGAALARADDAAYVDARPPIASPRAAVRRLKGLVHRAVSWEVRHVAVQVSAFACTITEAVRLLGERVDALERAGAHAGDPTGATAASFYPPAEPWAAVVAGLVGDPPGAVALVGCPALAAGLEAAGIETVAGAAAGEAPAGPPTAAGPPDALVVAGPLGAVVVSGPAARRPPGALAALAREAAAALAPGGTVVVVDADPVAWAAGRSPVEADLAGPRPLHPATWRLRLADAGLADAGLADHGGVAGGPAYAVAARRPAAP